NQLRAGIDLFAARNTTNADRALTSAAAAAPAWPDVYYERALVYQAEGRTSQAIADFQHYLQLRPNAADRDAVATRIGALQRSPTKAFVSGIVLALRRTNVAATDQCARVVGIDREHAVVRAFRRDVAFAQPPLRLEQERRDLRRRRHVQRGEGAIADAHDQAV